MEQDATPRREEPNIGWTEALGAHAGNPPEPRTSGDTIYALGREWTISPLENRICAQFEQMVRKRAKLAIQEAERDDGPEEANAMRSAYAADLGGGHYNWDGRYCRSARGDWPGLRYLIFLLLRRCHPDVTEDQVGRMLKEDARGCGLALAWALGRMGQESQGTSPGQGPNSQAPAVVTAATVPGPIQTNGAQAAVQAGPSQEELEMIYRERARKAATNRPTGPVTMDSPP
jgi:hypothetical protein